MNCNQCQTKINIENTIKHSPFCWPQRQTIWYECPACKSGSHLLFENGMVKLIRFSGFPGYEYEVLAEVNDSGIEIRVDPAYLHIWYHDKHYEIKEK